jgi:hypothetical protein
VSTALEISVDRVVDETDFSGVVHVSRGGEPLFERACGLADRAHGVANTSTTRFGIASGTKGFTALAIMSLVAEGSLGLDTSVRSVIGDELVGPRGPDRVEEEDEPPHPGPRRVLGKPVGELGDHDDEDEVEEQLEEGHPPVARTILVPARRLPQAPEGGRTRHSTESSRTDRHTTG